MGKDVLAIEVLMEAVVVSSPVLKQQRRGTLLTRIMASLNEGIVLRGIASFDTH